MTLEEIEALWAVDCKIDNTELAQESLSISELHNKYYKILIREKIAHKKAESEYKILLRHKHQYYTGSIDHETLKEKGWEPWRLKVLKEDLSLYYNSDPDLIAASTSVFEQNEKVEFLDSIIRSIANRGFQIKNALDAIKYVNGVM